MRETTNHIPSICLSLIHILLAIDYFQEEEPLIVVGGDQLVTINLQEVVDEFTVKQYDGGLITVSYTHLDVYKRQDFYSVEYRLIDNTQDLPAICNFPPIQASPTGVFSQLQKELQNSGRKVLFIGTPCHVMGLKTFLKQEYTNLLTVSSSCEGVSSAYAWECFLESQKKDGKVRNVRFDSKAFGFRKSLQLVFDAGNSREESQWWIPAMEAGLQLCRGCYT